MDSMITILENSYHKKRSDEYLKFELTEIPNTVD